MRERARERRLYQLVIRSNYRFRIFVDENGDEAAISGERGARDGRCLAATCMYARALWDTIIRVLFRRGLFIPRSFAALTVLVTTMSGSHRRAPLSRTNNRISDTRGIRGEVW